jgi:hypothetical protein
VVKQLMCVAALLLTIGCSSPTHPTTTARSSVEPLRTPITITYAINIPYADAAHALEAQHPDGVNLSPVQAQETFNFTDAYHGTPNVYYGPLAPPVGRYVFVGIVVSSFCSANGRTAAAGSIQATRSAPGWDGSRTRRQDHRWPPAA